MPPDFPNICEASRFYPLWLLAVFGVVVARVRARISISPLLVLLTVFLVALHIYCVVKLPDWLLRATLFSAVHEARVLLALGLTSILLVLFFLDRYRDSGLRKVLELARRARRGAGARCALSCGAGARPGVFRGSDS